ncbi:ABC-2 type transport system permease protein [Actinomadura luteofluorescens]|uniref:ABC-2 type transport system permease protein n=1 Tax=Actinomadura luteofluorescens TaxID=46163 RepID=A0A7Y9ESK7_9ACTN|nr:ABC transporter permease [Actinomadura luteofluorescens]NYD52370.1 ABC-2 type transport system permease protein [Actinomadura luteofluorescens]
MTATTLHAPAWAAGRDGGLTGTGMLLKSWLRRDRVMMPAWIYGLTALVSSTVYSLKHEYDTPSALAGFARGINDNPSTRALYGPVLNDGSVAGLSAWRVGATGAAFTAVMCVLLVVRHTRAEEEAGRLELVGAAAVGRRAPLTAALLTAVTAAGTLAAAAALVMILFGLPVAGSVAFGLSWFGAGLVFSGVAALTAQLAETSRLANGLALAVLGAAYLLRAVADAGSAHWLSWLSPIGWAQRLRPCADEQWAVLLLPLAAFVLLVAAAYLLTERRDLGAGILAPSLGPAHAPQSLRGPFTLWWRLQRGTLLGWAAGFLVYGLAIGGVADGVGDLVNGSDAVLNDIRKMGGQQDVADAFLATAMGLMALFTAAYAVQSVLRLRAEESGGRLEPVLATAVGRTRWAVAALAGTVAGTVVMLTATGLAVGLVHGARSGDLAGQLPRQLGAALAQLPSVWVVAAAAMLLFGALPRATSAAWGVLAVFLLLGQVGPLLGLPQAVMDLSPFTHTPKLPGAGADPLPLLALTAVAAVLAAAGLAAFRRRDVA